MDNKNKQDRLSDSASPKSVLLPPTQPLPKDQTKSSTNTNTMPEPETTKDNLQYK